MDREAEILISLLNRWDSRRRWVESLARGPQGLLLGLLIAAAVAAASRIWPLIESWELIIVTAILAAAGLVTGILITWIQRRSDIEKAKFADRQFGLMERTSTAVELHQRKVTTDPHMARQQMGDTLSAAEAIDTKEMIPWRFIRRDWYLIILATALLTAAVMIDNPAADEVVRRRAMEKVIQEQINRLEALEEQIEENDSLDTEALEEVTAPIRSALEELQEGDQSLEELHATLSEAEAELRELSLKRDPGDLLERLDGAAEPLMENEASQPLGEALQRGDLSAASVGANLLADELSSSSQEENTALAESLAQAAEALESVDPVLAGELAEASAALARGDIEGAQQALREAAATFRQRSVQQATAEQAAAAADQIGEGREAVAESGQPNQEGGTGQGSGATGQGGQESGQGQGEGQGSAQNQGTGSGSGGQEGGGAAAVERGPQGSGGPGPGGGHSENVYAPEFIDLSGQAGVTIEIPVECQNNPAECGLLLSQSPTQIGPEVSLIPYEQVFGDYRRAAYQALEEEYVPLGLRGYIKEYFTTLEP